MNECKTAKGPAKTRWTKTSRQGLLKNVQSGRYYARALEGGKQVWKSLKTKQFTVAEARLSEFMSDHRKNRKAVKAISSGKMTFGDAMAAHQRKINDDVEAGRTKESTAHYWNQIFTALLKSWPGLKARDIRRITSAECLEWAAKSAKAISSTRFNNTVAALRNVFEVAIEAGAIYANPAARMERVPIRGKKLTLPTAGQFIQMIEEIRTAGAWCSKDCADFVEGLAVTGARLRDVGGMEWRDVDFKKGEVVIRGDADTGTKNWEIYRVPMIPQARILFERMRATRQDEPPSAKVFRVREAQKAIDGACEKLGIPRITHHDMRHLFATVCIESGVDIPTISRWLNHKDGGALAMRTYGHLRVEYSQQQAARVSFASKA